MSTPELYYQPGGIAEQVLNRCSALKQPFNPTIWAPNGHMQSALGLLRTLSAKGSYTRQLVMTSDHGTLGLDWWCGADKLSYAAVDAPVVLFIHGINGGSHEGYIKWACVAAASRGWRAVVFNMRGCNGLPLTSARGYNAINTADVHVAVQSIRSRFPFAPLMAAGYSLGSVLLAKYVAEADNGLYSSDQQRQQQQPPATPPGVSMEDLGSPAAVASSGPGSLPDLNGSGLVAAALVSPPVCLHSTNSKLGKPNSIDFLYNLAVAYKLREYVKEHLNSIEAFGMPIDTAAMMSSWTVSSFDDAVTMRDLGYPAPHFYYRHACSTNYIPHIRTPTLIMLSRDDPFLGVLPQEQVRKNPFTALAATRRGGHLAFLQGLWPLGASYCDNVVDDWLGAALQEWRQGCCTGPASSSAEQPNSTSSSNSHGPHRHVFKQRHHQHHQRDLQQTCYGNLSLPTWVERAKAAGWQPQPIDPAELATAMCKCNLQADPLERSQRADAVLNVATAPAQVVAAAANKAASAAKYSWSLGFGRNHKDGAADSIINGLRGNGAWAPFEDLDSDDSNSSAAVGSISKVVGGEGGAAGVAAATDSGSPAVIASGNTGSHWRPLRSKL